MWTGTAWVPLREVPPSTPDGAAAYEPGMVANGYVWSGAAWVALAPAATQPTSPSVAPRARVKVRPARADVPVDAFDLIATPAARPLWKRWWVIAAAAVLLLGITWNLAGAGKTSNSALTGAANQSASATNGDAASKSPSASASTSVSPKAVDPEANPTNTAPVSTTGLIPAPVPSGAKSACRSGNPLANVYHPYRLQLITACSTVAGVVESVRHEDDGDYHIDILLDSPYGGMLDAGNLTYQHGWLVLEIVPADEPGCVKGTPPRPTVGTYNYGICTGANETPPSVGQHIWVTGPYVIDHWHDWAEIHPIWSISGSKPASGPPPPSPAPTTPKPVSGGTLSCRASASPPSPSRYSTVDILVQTSAGAQVSATAHYYSTDTTNTGTATGSGSADIPFRISRAKIGFQVVVYVSVSSGSRSATCSTSFTPQ
jgi:hypothetical protein